MILLFMIFNHIVDDYYLQGWLSSAKQKKYWRELPNYSDKYKFDYIIALVMHSFSWTFMIMLPIAYINQFYIGITFIITFFINMIIHIIVDNAKANLFKINLIQDQLIHLIQIIITFCIFTGLFK